MKRFITIALTALAIAGCELLLGPGKPAGTGTLSIGFGNGRAALPPEVVDTLRYEVLLTGPEGQTINVSVSPGETHNEQVSLGEWTIAAEAYSPEDVLTGTGTTVVKVKAGMNEARLLMRAVPPEFVAVTGITGVPTVGTRGVNLTLSGTVSPANATNQAIVWSVKTPGGTGASISGNSLSTTAAGIVVVTATIANGTAAGTDYTQDFSITINTVFVAVSNITIVPTVGTVGGTLTLSGTVSPANATNQAIVWTVKTDGGTGAAISGNSLSTTGAGIVVVTATIADGTAAGTDYTQDFNITITFPAYNMVLVPGGEVNVTNTGTGNTTNWGAGNNTAYAKPYTVSAFSMGETEITYELWYTVRTWAESNGYIFDRQGREGNDGTDGAAPTGAKQEPVTLVSWRDVVVWCNAYSERTGKTPVYRDTSDEILRDSNATVESLVDTTKWAGKDGYRLPTEAEWEYAARGGDPTDTTNWTYTYAGSNTLDDVAVYYGNSGSQTAAVKSKTAGANSLGLYDMSGNVEEWCWDVAGVSVFRMTRGGGFTSNPSDCEVAYQVGVGHATSFGTLGFRVVCAP